MSNDYFFLSLLLASNAVLLTVATIAVVRFEQRWRRIESFWDSPTGAALGDELDDSDDSEMREQTKATRRLEQRLVELQRAIKLIDRRSPVDPNPAERSLPIENAVRMARLGASADDLARNCGLNAGEAQLLRKLHGRAAVAANDFC